MLQEKIKSLIKQIDIIKEQIISQKDLMMLQKKFIEALRFTSQMLLLTYKSKAEVCEKVVFTAALIIKFIRINN